MSNYPPPAQQYPPQQQGLAPPPQQQQRTFQVPGAVAAYDAFPIPFDQTHVTVGIDWQFRDASKGIDLDVACFVFDSRGQELDVVFYGNLESADGSMVHSGDNTDGRNEPGSDDERISVDLTRLHPAVSCLVFPVVVQGKSKDFGDCTYCHVRLRQTNMWSATPLKEYDVATQGPHTAFILCMLFRDPYAPERWLLNGVGLPSNAKGLDQVDLDIDRALSVVIPPQNLMQRQRVDRQALKKGQGFILRRTRYKIGLGWDSRCDLDTHVHLADSVSSKKAHVFYRHQEEPGVHLLGDNVTGQGAGDDEEVMLDLARVDPSIDQLHIVVNIFTQGDTFNSVDGEYVRLCCVDTGRCIAKFAIDDNSKLKKARSAWFCTIYRVRPRHNQWRFLSVAKRCDGLTQPDHFEAAFKRKVAKIQQKLDTRHVEIVVRSGADLLACDGIGRKATSDPYCKITYVDHKGKSHTSSTPVIKKTLNPVWNSRIGAKISGDTVRFRLEVFDKDKLGADDFMGQALVQVPVSELPVSTTLQLQPGEGKQRKKAKGSVTLDIRLE